MTKVDPEITLYTMIELDKIHVKGLVKLIKKLDKEHKRTGTLIFESLLLDIQDILAHRKQLLRET